MNRQRLALAMLAAAEGKPYSPVQIQKAMFLLAQKSPEMFTEDRYDFQPYDYGPFDRAVYTDIRCLQAEGLAVADETSIGWMNSYRATDDGVTAGRAALAGLDPKLRQYVEEVSRYVRSKSFRELVSEIYEDYPEMRQHSIFRD